MTVRLFTHETNFYFHSHELREIKVKNEKIVVALIGGDTLNIRIQHPEEILKDILEAVEKGNDMSFPIESCKIVKPKLTA
jgi:hypothetical protein